MPSDSEPRTEAGRELLEREAFNARSFALITTDAILAIETEAARLALEEVAERVRGLPLYQNAEAGVTTTETTTKRLREYRAAVLALLSAKEEGS